MRFFDSYSTFVATIVSGVNADFLLGGTLASGTTFYAAPVTSPEGCSWWDLATQSSLVDNNPDRQTLTGGFCRGPTLNFFWTPPGYGELLVYYSDSDGTQVGTCVIPDIINFWRVAF
jgi:hypothetical protein